MSDYDDTWIPIEEFKWSAEIDVWEVAQAEQRRVGFARYEISLDGHWRWFDLSTHDVLNPQPTHFKRRSKPPKYEPKVVDVTRSSFGVNLTFRGTKQHRSGDTHVWVFDREEYELLRKATLPPYEELPE